MAVGTVAVSAYSAYSADQAAGEQLDASKDAQAAQMQFEREKIEKWEKVYGPIQTNLAAYYSSLTPEYYEAQGLEAFQREHQVAKEKVETSFAQRGITDSGIAATSDLAFAVERAESRATIRAQAPSIAAEEQKSFLSLGLGIKPGASYSQALATQTQEARQSARLAEQQAGEATEAFVSEAGTALSDYFNKPTQPVVTDTTAKD